MTTLLAALAVQAAVLLLLAVAACILFDVPIVQSWLPKEFPKWQVRLPFLLAKYFDEPEERIAWGIRLLAGAALLAGVVDLLWYGGTLPYNDFSVEMIVGAVTVLFLDELNRLRSKAEYKKHIIRQMASRSNDFALDAARIAKDEAWLYDGSLRRVELRGANLQGASLWRADLQEADLIAANLQLANLMEANLQGAFLVKTDLQGAFLTSADLEGADLAYADLRRTILIMTSLERADITGAEYNRYTLWPDGFDPVAAGAILEEWP